MSSGTPIGQLLLTVVESIIQVFLICIAGYILARRGILDKKLQKSINRLNINIFTPALLFSKVAFFLSPSKLAQLWVIPVFFVVTTVVSAIIGYAICVALKLKVTQRNFAVAAAMFMNSNSLPIALMQSLVTTVPGMKWGADDTSDAMIGRALTYLVVYSTLGNVLRWSYGVKLLSKADPEMVEEESAPPATQMSNEKADAKPVEVEGVPKRDVSHDLEQGDDAKTIGPDSADVVVSEVERTGEAKLISAPNSRPLTPTRQLEASTSATPSVCNVDVIVRADEFPGRRSASGRTSTLLQALGRRVRHRMLKIWRGFLDFMTPPLWAALASIVIACIQPLQSLLQNHVQPVTDAISTAGNCSIPLTLVVLGGYFYSPPKQNGLPTHKPDAQGADAASPKSWRDKAKDMFCLRRRKHESASSQPKPKKRPGETTTIIVSLVSRMLLAPAVLLPIMVMFAKFDVQRLFEDPVFVVSNVLLIASPPALTLAQLTQAASGDAFERLLSRTVFWGYCILTAPSTIVIVIVGLQIAQL
ncbi:hypothetical protein WOLCODRAFT_165952 [Wolfiporia cocos MD-104 SS10]|uniref:Auxin efflux carrier n=1 Tax=Wolfiporia cocos (strain MD-104) TaxID=742152 RepID=A0A2H3IYG8_WOLCO|nr:hypothetical protein WOLCODRAFT_165952 [Wolfiporia cocos MD-104 SS10]